MAIKDPDFKVNSSDLHYAQHIASLARLKFSQFNSERYNTKKGGIVSDRRRVSKFPLRRCPLLCSVGKERAIEDLLFCAIL